MFFQHIFNYTEIGSSYRIYWNLVGDLARRVYEKLNDPIAKLFLNLCRFERFPWYRRDYNNLLKEFRNFDKKDIENAAIEIAKTDWLINHKFVLLLFTDFSTKVIPLINQVLNEFREDLEWSLQRSIRSIEREEGIFNGDFSKFTKEKLQIESIFKSEILFERKYLIKYSFLLNILRYEISEENYLKTLLSNFNIKNYPIIIKNLKNFKETEYATLVYILDEEKILQIEEFNRIKEFYLENIKKIKKE